MQKRKEKALAELKVQLKKDEEGRAPRDDAASAVEEKLWSLRDASSQDLLDISFPIFPEMKDITEDTDGCGSRFQEGRQMLGESQDPLPAPLA